MITNLYIDYFNLYYRALKDTPPRLGACPGKTLFVIAFTNRARIGTKHNANRITYPYA